MKGLRLFPFPRPEIQLSRACRKVDAKYPGSKKAAFKKNRLHPDTTKKIRQEVAEELGLNTTQASEPIIDTRDQEHEDRQNAEDQVTEIEREPTIVETEETRTFQILQKNILLYSGMNPRMRPTIPRLKTSNQTKNIISTVNNVLAHIINDCNDIITLHDYIYSAAVTITEMHNQTTTTAHSTRSKSRQPAWQTRLEKKIKWIRKDIGILTQYTTSTKHTSRITRKVNIIIDKYKNDYNKTTAEILDYTKQRLQIYANRMRRYKEAYQRRIDNKLFQNNQKAFYRKIQNPYDQTHNNNTPTAKETRDFWCKIWEEPVRHKENTEWIRRETERMSNVQKMPAQNISKEDVRRCLTGTHTEWIRRETERMSNVQKMPAQNISKEDVRRCLTGTHNWKMAEPDKLQNYWYKKLTCIHEKIAAILNDFLKQPNTIPKFLTEGNTYLLPKTMTSSSDQSKYRPITCLPTLYKLLTGILCNKIYEHIDTNNLMTQEQKGCRRKAQGCKDQLIIDAVIMEHAKKNKRDLHTAFIDYQKAFDSVPHSWLIESLRLYKIDTQIVTLLESLMNSWKTNLILNNQTTDISIHIKRGIFQGDALSSLWFCIALNPLSSMLTHTDSGFKISEENVSHLMYMDDIKLISNTQNGLNKLIRTTEEFSNDIRMNFGLEKCKTNHMKRGKWCQSDDFILLEESGGGTVRSMDKHETYKYLGFIQSQGINGSEMKNQIKNTFKTRLNAVMKTQLCGSNKVQATNTFVMPTITYSFGIIKWTPTELDELNRSVRTTYTKYRSHHPKACKERFHLPRDIGGRGVMDLRLQYKKQIKNQRTYFHMIASTSSLYDTISKTDKKLTPLNLSDKEMNIDAGYTIALQKSKWQGKELHGRYLNTLDLDSIHKPASVAWLTHGTIFPETEGFMCAIEDEVIATRSYLKYIIKDPTIKTTVCRMCGEGNENIEHIISSCTTLA
ncbi:uncharacterized protein LOC115877806 [Sitophilus oryzae]|uniref:Uncharacterized protein LOC115877806 n=1 Tax=Sitophilus oryzae TaxID=7048 RepID=A0A6J2XFD3_SITOR|nr:uncharacterized protein LOC115877806 [Sitophilus oryzae]